MDRQPVFAPDALIGLVITANGRVRDCNSTAAVFLQRSRETICEENISSLIDLDSLGRLMEGLESARANTSGEFVVRVTYRLSDGTSPQVVTLCEWLNPIGGVRDARLLGIYDEDGSKRIAELESTTTLLTGFIDVSSEAMWCMEYKEPVNLSAAPQEIIRQIFENDCHWRMCNHAMARLYNLPEGLDFNRQPISAYFRRNRENEAFVRQLIEARFHIDAAPSLDVRHDGSFAYIENTVRCVIVGDWMYRLWGTVRDVTEFRTTENNLEQRQREVTDILQSLPDPILVVDTSRRALALNPAFERTFGWRASQFLGNDVASIVNLEARQPGQRRWFAEKEKRWVADVVAADGSLHKCDIRFARMNDESDRRFVMSLRPVARLRQRSQLPSKQARAVSTSARRSRRA